jgi:hypothetical protein
MVIGTSVKASFFFALITLPIAVFAHNPDVAAPAIEQDTFGIKDLIQIAEFMPPNGYTADPVLLSPDRSRGLVLIRKADVDRNSNLFSVWCFRTADGLPCSSSAALVEARSRTSVPGIAAITWKENSQDFAYLCSGEDQPTQVCELDVETGVSRILTSSSTNIVAYDLALKGGSLAYLAERPRAPLLDDEARRSGFVVTDQSIAELASNGRIAAATRSNVVAAYQPASGNAIPLEIPSPAFARSNLGISIAPDGQKIIIPVLRFWGAFEDQAFRAIIPERDQHLAAASYWLIDLSTGRGRWAIDAPSSIASRQNVRWTPSGATVLISNVYRPPHEGVRTRSDGPWLAATGIADPRVLWLTNEPTCIAVNYRQFAVLGRATGPRLCKPDGRVVSERRARLSLLRQTSKEFHGGVLEVQEGLNSSPKLVFHETGGDKVVLDPNPNLPPMAKVQNRSITLPSGKTVQFGIFLPNSSKFQFPRPFVIQNNGWSPQRFLPSGHMSTSGYAAQPLAAAGIVVAQLPDISEYGPREDLDQMEIYEQIVRSLSDERLVDSEKVGIQGFSRSGFWVRKALIFSRQKFVAANLSDASEGSYSTYATSAGTWGKGTYGDDLEFRFGGAPIGAGLQTWIKSVPNFNLQRMHSALRQTVHGEGNAVELGFDTLNILRRLGKPVEHVWLPDALHSPVVPSERVTEQGGAFDWFRFWLLGEQDNDPGKAEQYKRWRALRVLRDDDERKNR